MYLLTSIAGIGHQNKSTLAWFLRDMKINGRVIYKINKPLSGLLVCRLIMSLAERLSSKFHICSRSFASRSNIHFSDNLSAADLIGRHTSRLNGVYLLNNHTEKPSFSVISYNTPFILPHHPCNSSHTLFTHTLMFFSFIYIFFSILIFFSVFRDVPECSMFLVLATPLKTTVKAKS